MTGLIYRIIASVIFTAAVVFIEWNKTTVNPGNSLKDDKDTVSNSFNETDSDSIYPGKSINSVKPSGDVLRELPGNEKQSLYRPTIDAFTLVTLILFLFLFILLITNDFRFSGILTAGFVFPIFVEMLIYDTILLIFLPAIRKRYTAGFCATLWALPNFLYLSMYVVMQDEGPHWVLRLNESVLRWLIIIWAVGFAAIMIYYTVSHLIYRKSILSVSHAPDEKTVCMWKQHQLETGLNKAPYKICVSPDVHTPLTIGLFKRTTYLVLPDKSFSEIDLDLIMEHEIIHIVRMDSRTKFFMMTSKALFWFNPFLWVSMKKCAEDLELSCDELLMRNASDEEQMRYAKLILSTAGDERGFTTCLSANANALRYRLHEITKPSDKKRGLLLLAIIMFVMLFMSNSVAISCSAKPVKDSILSQYDFSVSSVLSGDADSQASDGKNEDTSGIVDPDSDSDKEYVLSNLVYDDGTTWKKFSAVDPEGLMEYVGSLEVSRVYGNYKPTDGSRLTLYFSGEDDEWIDIDISDRWICCYKYPSEKYYENIEAGGISFRRSVINSIRNDFENKYYLTKEPDWDVLLSFLTPLDEE